MKTNQVIFILLLLNTFAVLYAQKADMPGISIESYDEYDEVERDVSVSFRLIIPPPNNYCFSFVDISVGINYCVIPAWYYIGIAGDLAIGTDWLAMFSEDDGENKDKLAEKEYLQLGFSFGARVYNMIRISKFRFIPFVGCDLFVIQLPALYVGAEMLFEIVGVEYAYYFPIWGNFPMHRIALKLHVPRDY